MATSHLISVEEYFHLTAEPDVEYVEGKVISRALPQRPHSKLQTYLARTLHAVGHPLGYEVWVEQRIRTQSTPARYRVPDVCLTLGEPAEDIFTTPPHLCVEILSPDDNAIDLLDKVREYLAFGVSYTWLIDPITLEGEIYSSSSVIRVEHGVFSAGPIVVDLHDMR